MNSTNEPTRIIDHCLISGGKVEKILDLGMHPYADTFVSKSQLAMTEPVIPLECYLCKESGQVQLRYQSNDFERYNLYSYSYTSANSAFSRGHWDAYYKTISEKFDLIDKRVVEIGSNDGYLLQQFKPHNTVLGVDPSATMAEVARSQYGITTESDVFNAATSKKIQKEFGSADIIIANNVFNHSNEPLDFAKGVSGLLNRDGVFVFEQPYWLDTIQSKKFDQIYHEHISYFTVKSAYTLLAKVGLEIIDVEHVDYHGGSLRVYAKKTAHIPKQSDMVKAMINKETEAGLFDPNTYKQFQADILRIRDTFLAKLYNLKSQGHSIVAVGAAAKGNTFLNFYRLDKTVIDYVTDASAHKQGKYTPLSRIPIVSDDIFSHYKEVYALVLSWNISEALKAKLRTINNKIRFL
ncbi:class I SAM-dependent methyltransferase [Candidatus Parcubacteria bacterium]|nr:class I SAM-dependent methyltransferase [Candidatus Parcubacteria bacterium]